MSESLQASFDSRAAYHQAVDAVLASANRHICVFDRDLQRLEFDSRARADAISDFLAGGRDRSLRIVLHDLDYLTRHMPRLTTLLKRYSHCLAVRQTPEPLRDLADSFILSDGINGAILHHANHFRGKLLMRQPTAVQGWQQRFEDLWLESTPGAPATHLGL